MLPSLIKSFRNVKCNIKVIQLFTNGTFVAVWTENNPSLGFSSQTIPLVLKKISDKLRNFLTQAKIYMVR